MAAEFHTTCWTMVLDAGGADASVSRPALEELCRLYWRPLHAYVLGHGMSAEDAEDITQSFFALLLEKNLPGRASPVQGRFRCFLLTSIRNFVSKWQLAPTALKRGGAAGEHVWLDDPDLHLSNQISTSDTPDAAYDRKWAHTLIEIAVGQLAAEQGSSDNAARFEDLRPVLFDVGTKKQLPELAARMGMSEPALRTALSRLRTRLRELIRAEVARLVDDPAEVDDELAYLLRVLRT